MSQKKATKKEIEFIKASLIERYKEAKSELRYTNLYELLVCVMLSAQCTDKRVNIITPKLFEKYPNIEALAEASLEDLIKIIKSCSFFNNKAKNLKSMALQIRDEYKSKIPLEAKELMKLSGVGQKTANVVLIEYCNANKMAVDTHVFRVSHRLGLSFGKTPNEVEKDLVKKFKTDLSILHQGMVLFGRYICKAKNPLCESECFLKNVCKSSHFSIASH